MQATPAASPRPPHDQQHHHCHSLAPRISAATICPSLCLPSRCSANSTTFTLAFLAWWVAVEVATAIGGISPATYPMLVTIALAAKVGLLTMAAFKVSHRLSVERLQM